MIVINAKILVECIYVIMLFLKARFYHYSETKMENKGAKNFGKGKTRMAMSVNFLCVDSYKQASKQNVIDLFCLGT